MVKQNTVALIVDNPKRDLRGIVLTAYQLALAGQSTLVVPMYAQGYDIPLLRPGKVLLNYIRQSNADLVKTYKTLGCGVAVMDTEGGILSKKGLREPNTWAASLRDSGLASLVDAYFFWGSAVQDAFAVKSGFQSRQMYLTGCPRYDLCAPPWNAVLAYERSGFVLVNTNFSAINPAFTRSSDSEKHIFRSLGWSDAYITRWFKELEEVFVKYLDEVEALARALPDQMIVVRPHPFENRERYERRFEGVANLVIDGSGDVLNMIHEALCVVHLNCGTAVDALLQQKVPVSLEYLNTELLLDHTPLPSRLSLKPGSRQELVTMVLGLIDGNQPFDMAAAYSEIEPWFYRADGQAAARVASAILSMPQTRPSSSFYRAVCGGRNKPTANQLAQGVLTLALGSRLVATLRGRLTPARRGKDVHVSDVQALLDFYASASKGPSMRARYARSPITGLPLNTIEIAAND